MFFMQLPVLRNYLWKKAGVFFAAS